MQNKKNKARASKHRIEYINQYQQENTTQFLLRFNNKTDKEIIKHLQNQPNKNDYIRKLVSVDMNKTTTETEYLSSTQKVKSEIPESEVEW